MKYEKNRKIAGIDEFKLRKLMKILILPLIAVFLIIVIVIADRHSKGKAAAAASTGTKTAVSMETAGKTGAEKSSIGPDNSKYVNDFSGYGLQKNSIPEIDTLVKNYQKARTDGDAAAMYRVFGRKDKAGLDALQKKLTEEKKVYEAYKDTVNYILPGAEDGSYIVYISCKIKFRGIDTPAPMLTRAYVYKNAAGSYVMKEPDTLTEAEQKLVDNADKSEDVRVMDSTMRSELAKAVISDAKLGSFYQMLSGTGTAAVKSPSAGTGSTSAKKAAPSETVKEATIQIKDAEELTAAETTSAAAETLKAGTSAAAESTTAVSQVSMEALKETGTETGASGTAPASESTSAQ